MIGTLTIFTAEDPDVLSKLIDDAGPVAGLFVLVLGIVVFLLWRSMTKQLKRIDPELAPGPEDAQRALDRTLTAEALERGDAAATAAADESPKP